LKKLVDLSETSCTWEWRWRRRRLGKEKARMVNYLNEAFVAG
jgi:hypothetical protein